MSCAGEPDRARGRRPQPINASASSRWPFPSTPATPTISPARTCSDDPVQLAPPRRPSTRAAAPRLDLGLVQAEQHRAARPSSRRASPWRSRPARVSPTTCPRRSTVMRSAMSNTSSSLWLMKTIAFPSSRSRRRFSNRSFASSGREHRRRLVEDQQVDAPIERLQDLDPLLLADGEVLDDRARARPGTRTSSASVATFSCARPCPGSAWPSSPRITFSVTVNGSTSTKCWWTIPIPCAIATARRRDLDLLAVHDDASLVGRVHPVEDPHQRRLAGAVLPDQRVDLAGAQLQGDVVVGDDAGESLRDVLHHDERRGARAPRLSSSLIDATPVVSA